MTANDRELVINSWLTGRLPTYRLVQTMKIYKTQQEIARNLQ